MATSVTTRNNATFMRALADRAGALERIRVEVANGVAAKPEMAALADIAHKLHGAAGVYGFSRLSRLAGELEELVAESDVIPLDLIAAAIEPVVADCRKILASGQSGQAASVWKTHATAGGRSNPPAAGHLPSVLIVDDDPAITEIVCAKLAGVSLRPIAVPSGEAAFDILKGGERPALIILDRMMPGIAGEMLLRKIHAMDGLSDVPVVFLTARNRQSDIMEGFRLGAADYIVKPFDPDRLVVRCLRLIAPSHRTARQHQTRNA